LRNVLGRAVDNTPISTAGMEVRSGEESSVLATGTPKHGSDAREVAT
jgi:hypothetical protein